MPPLVRRRGLRDYQQTWQEMRAFVDAANDSTGEEIWLLQHPPVYTLGRSGRREHLLRGSDIPLVHSDRGGQITYHAPGQLIAYLMLNIKRRRLGLRQFVRQLEAAVVRFLAAYNIRATGDEHAPGVYVDGAKIAALGLRLRRGWSYHGVSINIDMDMAPYADINPCGHAGMAVTQLAALAPAPPMEKAEQQIANCLLEILNND